MDRMTVHWNKCGYNLFWCRLDANLLDDPRLELRFNTLFGVHRLGISGVYIIWAGIDNRVILKVGSGIIRDRLGVHLRDPKIQAYKNRGVYATWAPILFVDKPVDKQKGIERYLGWLLSPKLSERFPANVDPIFVNLPVWDKPTNPLLSSRNQIGQIPLRSNNPFQPLQSKILQDRLEAYLQGSWLSK